MNSFTVGIIGAGQLGAFLCEAARKLGLQTIVLAQQPNEPAVALADQCIFGGLSDTAAINALRRAANVVTFEREDIGSALLTELDCAMQREDFDVYPRPYILRLLQDKAKQKRWLVQNGFPTAEFLDGDTFTQAQILEQFEWPLVQKAKRGGFDGRGVQVVDKNNTQHYWSSGAIVEQYVPFDKELSALIARDASGNLACYPLIESVAKRGEQILDYAVSPARISRQTSDRALQLAAEIVTKLQGVGVFAIEMFVMANGSIMVNEISPRVHNTGHLTLQASETSQFEQHLRAICGLGLGSTAQSSAALCKNVLHESEAPKYEEGPFACHPLDQNLWFHWYGKEQTGDGRKLGHICCIADSVEEAIAAVHNFAAPSSSNEAEAA